MIARTSLRTLLLLAVVASAFGSALFAQGTPPVPGLGTNATVATDPYAFTVSATLTPASDTTATKPTNSWVEVGVLVNGSVPDTGWQKGPVHKITGTAFAAFSDTFAHLLPGYTYWGRSAAQFGTAPVVYSGHFIFSMMQETAQLSVAPVSTYVLAAEGTSATLAVTATGVDISIQWLKGTVPVPGATGPMLTLPNVTAATAGIYTCKVTNPAPAPLVNTVTTSITLAVASLTPYHTAGTPLETVEGSTLAFTASITPADAKATYLWDSGVTLSTLGTTVTGQNTATFTIKGALPVQGGSHVCKVTSSQAGNPSVSVSTFVDVNRKPVIDPFTFGAVSVGQDVGAAIPRLDFVVENMPAHGTSVATATITAKGLPAGLSFVSGVVDSGRHLMLGTVTGRPTTPTPAGHPAMVTITATNGWGSTSTVVPLTVNPLPAAAVGTHAAIFSATQLNANLGGAATLTVTSTAGFTGSLQFGGATIPLTGQFVYDPVAQSLTGSTHITFKLPSAPTVTVHATLASTIYLLNNTFPFQISLTLDSGPPSYTPQGPTAYAQNSPDADPAAAATVAGLHNFYTIPANPLPVGAPAGSSFGTFTVASNGTAAWSLTLADGSTKLTGSCGFSGSQGSTFYKVLYGGHGYLSGSVSIVPKATTGTYDRVVGGFNWIKLAPASTADHGYPSFNFSPSIAGSSQVVVPGNILWAPVTSPAKLDVDLSMAAGGLTDATQGADFSGIPATIATTTFATVVNPPAIGINPKVTLTINNTTGAISGGFTLTDVVAGKPVLRNVTYQGLTSLFDSNARGFFLLTPLPGTPGPTPQSGFVLMAPPGP